MSATITYKGAALTTVTNETKVLTTSGKYMEDDVTILDVTGGSPTLQTKTKTYTPTTSAQTDTVTADAGYDGLDEVDITVNAMPSGSTTTPATTITANPTISVNGSGLISATVSKTQSITPTVSAGYVSSGTAGTITVSGSNTQQLTVKGSADMTASGATVTAPAGYYTSNATKTISSGTEGTPTATKGTVNNHAITVTPSVTNSAGYISGGTHSGTGVSVSASELVSGSETKTANGTYDVTNLASLVVNVSGGGGKNAQIVQSTTRTTSTSYTKLCGDITVSKTGTYDVYWTGFRSSTSGTWGTQLYIGSTGYGSQQATFTNHIQNVHLSNVSLTANQVVSVYGRSRGSNYYAYVGQLTIIEA